VLWFYDHTVQLKVNMQISFYLDYSFRYTTPTALGTGQEIEQINMANVFYPMFLNVFLFMPRLLRFSTFKIFLVSLWTISLTVDS